jgi:endonuclease YncB( thermonuclease family)
VSTRYLKRSEAMNIGRLTLPAMALVSVAALTAPDARAQSPRLCDGRGAGSAEVARVIDGRSFILADGREVRLAAVESLLPVPGDEDEARVAAALAAKSALDILLAHREVDLSVTGSGSDRYGRLTAWVFINPSSGGILVQRELVAAGHALVSPVPASPCRAYLQAAEREARSRRLGLWGEPYSVVKNTDDPADVLADQGRFVVAEGKVRSVRESAGIIYINFGQHRSDQFIATLLKRNEGPFAGAGVAPKALAGRMIEVRGWIEERGGPAVEVTRPEQIEIIH